MSELVTCVLAGVERVLRRLEVGEEPEVVPERVRERRAAHSSGSCACATPTRLTRPRTRPRGPSTVVSCSPPEGMRCRARRTQRARYCAATYRISPATHAGLVDQARRDEFAHPRRIGFPPQTVWPAYQRGGRSDQDDAAHRRGRRQSPRRTRLREPFRAPDGVVGELRARVHVPLPRRRHLLGVRARLRGRRPADDLEHRHRRPRPVAGRAGVRRDRRPVPGRGRDLPVGAAADRPPLGVDSPAGSTAGR